MKELMVLITLGSLSVSTNIGAHGGTSMANDPCVFKIGSYTMHFTLFSPNNHGTEEFCENMPSTGLVVAALDMFPKLRRRKPSIDVRVIEGGMYEPATQSNTIVHLPFSSYPTGSISFKHNFPNKGRFVVKITAKDGDKKMISEFPFSVGFGREQKIN